MKIMLFAMCSLCISLTAVAHPFNCNDASSRLSVLAEADQKIRRAWNVIQQNPQTKLAEKEQLQERWRKIDGANLEQLKKIIIECGWPNTKEASHNAWLLTQHADSDRQFQIYAKSLLEQAVEAGVGAPRDLAYLADRIALSEGRPQEYGTQFSQKDRCDLMLEPVDDRKLVNIRRLKIGLQSLEEYETEGRKRLVPADCTFKTVLP